MLKVCAALSVGACLGLLYNRFAFKLEGTRATEATSLSAAPTSLRQGPVLGRSALASIPGASPWKEIALAAIEDSKACGRDVSMKAHAHSHLKAVMSNLNSEDKAQIEQMKVIVNAKKKAAAAASVDDLPGVVPPWGFWDPVGLATDTSEGKLLFYREAELKHGRVCMLATVGFAVGELFHPINWVGIDQVADKPSLFQFTDLSSFWPAAVVALGAIEYIPGDRLAGGELKPGVVPGDLGWDPLGLKPDDPEDFEKLQNNEILHGRLAMISILGQVSEELASGEKLHWPLIFTGVPGAVGTR